MVTNGTLDLVYFDCDTVHRLCKRQKDKTSSGPDGIPPMLYKILASSLASPLSMIFNLIMQFGALPVAWKSAIVTPIFKKGVSSDPGNYRPISLTCVASKLLKQVIKRDLITHLNQHKILSPSQHGFLEKYSTYSNLLEAITNWRRNIDTKTETLVA